jgi:hypothetical protein
MLEDNYNSVINQLHSILNPIPQAPPPTQVESVDRIVQDAGKTIRWDLKPVVREVHNWMRNKAKRQHKDLQNKARDLLIKQRRKERMERKWEKRKVRRTEPSIVVDSGATFTCIRTTDASYVQVLSERSSGEQSEIAL